MKTESSIQRNWKIWKRSKELPPFQMQERDIKIILSVFRHRFLTRSHIHALLGGSEANLSRRCRLLWEHGYLERPRAQRPTKILTEEIVYALGKKGARFLDHLDPNLRIGHLDWTETPKKQIGWPYVDHQLGVSTFMVALKLACDRAGYTLHWNGHFDRKRYRILAPSDKIAFFPDAYFALEVPRMGWAHHFLELDRGSVSLKRMRAKYNRYFFWWRDGRDQRPFKHFRVLTVTHDPDHLDSLRRVAVTVGRDSGLRGPWQALMFSHLEAFDLEHPERILEPIFQFSFGKSYLKLI